MLTIDQLKSLIQEAISHSQKNIRIDYKEAFRDIELPMPENEKSRIVLVTRNASDGKGDAGHLKEYCLRVKKLVQGKYEVTPILEVNKYHSLESTFLDKSQKTFLDNCDKSQQSVLKDFRQFCIDEKLDGVDYTIFEAGFHPFDQPKQLSNEQQAKRTRDAERLTDDENNRIDDKLKTILSEQALGIQVSLGAMLDGFDSDFSCLQLATPGEGTMSLEERGNGIAIDLYTFNINTAANKLVHVESNAAKALVARLLNVKAPASVSNSLDEAKTYLQSTSFMPGYPQTKWGAENFILTGILKNTQNGKLKKNCDFFLPKGCANDEMLLNHLKNLALDVNVEKITPNSQVNLLNSNNNSSARVRIFCGFFVNNAEYNDLFRVRTDIGLGSGDNTILRVLSSSQLPFFQNKLGCIDGFLRNELLELIKRVAKNQQNNELKHGLENLIKYFTLILDFNRTKKYFSRRQGSADRPIHDKVVQKLIFDDAEYLDYIRKIAKLAQAGETLTAWQYISQYIRTHHSYDDNFKAILCANFYQRNPTPKYTISGKPAQPLRDIHCETALNHYFSNYKMYDEFRNASILKAYELGWITSEDLFHIKTSSSQNTSRDFLKKLEHLFKLLKLIQRMGSEAPPKAVVRAVLVALINDKLLLEGNSESDSDNAVYFADGSYSDFEEDSNSDSEVLPKIDSTSTLSLSQLHSIVIGLNKTIHENDGPILRLTNDEIAKIDEWCLGGSKMLSFNKEQTSSGQSDLSTSCQSVKRLSR